MGLAVRGSNSGRGKRVPVLQSRPNRLWGPPSLLFNGYRGPLLGIKRLEREVQYSPLSSADIKNYWRYSGHVLAKPVLVPSRSVRLTAHLHQVPRLRMRGVIPPLCLYGDNCTVYIILSPQTELRGPFWEVSITRFHV